jgi:hypothetical protein
MRPKHVRAQIIAEDGRKILIDIEGSEAYVAERLTYIGELSLLRFDSGREGTAVYNFKEPVKCIGSA